MILNDDPKSIILIGIEVKPKADLKNSQTETEGQSTKTSWWNVKRDFDVF